MNTITDSVRIVIFDKKNKDKFLLLSELDDPANIKLPGGKFNSTNETPLLAAQRELEEELNITKPLVPAQVCELVNNDGSSKRFIFKMEANPENIKPSKEIDHIEWVDKNTVPDCLNKSHILAALEMCV